MPICAFSIMSAEYRIAIFHGLLRFKTNWRRMETGGTHMMSLSLERELHGATIPAVSDGCTGNHKDKLIICVPPVSILRQFVLNLSKPWNIAIRYSALMMEK